jgi:curved DNA-binding protein CbpA
MDNPYEVLGLSPEAGETEIRQRYLELVRQFPPDRAPERFAAIRAAYDELHDPVRRLRDRLLEPVCRESLDQIVAEARSKTLDVRRLPVREVLKQAEQL